MQRIKDFFKSIQGVIVVIFTVLLSVIYFLVGKNNQLEAENSLNNTNVKDTEINGKLDLLKEKQDAEKKKQEELEKARTDALKEDPEDFWKKH